MTLTELRSSVDREQRYGAPTQSMGSLTLLLKKQRIPRGLWS